MRRLPLALTSALLVLACGDDDTPQDPTTGSTSTGEADSTTVEPAPTSTTVEPTSTTDASTTAVDSTGPVAECGNGIVEDGEECDDQNVLDDDDCSSACTIPFVELWTVTYDGGDADVANHALFDEEGNLYVLGNVEVGGQYDVWLRQYTPDGREGFTWTYAGAFGGDDFGRRMAWLDGDLVIVGTEATETNGDDVLILRLSLADQTPVWTQQYDGPGSGPEPADNGDYGGGIAVDADGNLLVAASISVDGQMADISLRKLDPDGGELWVHQYDDPTAHDVDTASAVVVDGTDVYLIGNSFITADTEQSWIRKLDTDGGELWTQTIPGVEFTNGALDSQGNLVLVGLEDDNPDNVNLWAGKFDADFAELATTTHDGPSGSYDVAGGVALGASDSVYLTGSITIVGQQANIWSARYMPDLGLRLWNDAYGNEDAQLNDVGRGVAVSADETRVAVVGFESVLGQDSNVWVRMYEN